MKKKTKLLSIISTSLAGLALSLGVVSVVKNKEQVATAPVHAYTNGDAATYYNSIGDSLSGNTLLTALRTLNLDKRKETVGYNSMGTTPSGQFKYTDYDPNYVQYDSNGQPYGTRISSFYTYTSATSWNREHVWPNSHGGGSGGSAGSPYPDADIHMPRPTISSENSSRGNSFFVEGMNHSSNGWDPYTAGYSAESRGEAARITFYCMTVNSKLSLAPNNTAPSGKDPITGNSYSSGTTMGNLETLLKWNINYPVTQREKNRNEGAEYLQGNRNAFVDHPEYACKIWGNVNSTTKSLCSSASWEPDVGISISKNTANIAVDGELTINATASDSSQISWYSEDTTVVEVSSATSNSGANITLTGVGPGTANVIATATISGTAYTAQCAVTVSSSGGGGSGGGDSDGDYIVITNNSSVSNGDKVVIAMDLEREEVMGVTGWNNNNDATVSNSDSNWKQFTVSNASSSGFKLKDDAADKYIAAPTNNHFKYDTSGGTISADSEGHFVCNSRYLCKNNTYYRCYTSIGSYVPFYLYKVNTSVAKTLSSISVETAPTKTTYTAGETFDPTGLVITRTYSDSSSDTYTYAGHESEFTFSPTLSTALTTSNTSISLTYAEKNTSQAITVNAPVTLSSIAVKTAPTKTSYTAGETFDPTGLVITRNYSNNTSDTYSYADHESEFSFSPSLSTALTTGNTSVSITYNNKSCNQAITVSAPVTISSISIATAPTKTTYTAGESFDPTGLVIRRHYSNSTTDTYSYSGHESEFSFSPNLSASLTTANTSITITYSNKNCNQSIVVNAPVKTLSSIAVSNPQTAFTLDDTFVFGGTVTAYFSDSTNSNVTSSATFSGYNMSVPGQQTVTVSYTYNSKTETTTYQIVVNSSGGGSGGETEDFSGTYNYGNKGSAWTLTDCEDKGDYWLCPKDGNTSVALIEGIFTNKTINSTVVITINSGTYGSGGNPVETTFEVYNSNACTSKLNAIMSGTLPTSKTYTSVTYTISQSNVSSFASDLAIKITKPGKQIRLSSINVEFSYETAGSTEPITSITATANKTFYVGETIYATDISVKGQSNQTITDFSFTPYTFKYSDALSGGTLSNVLMSVSYLDMNAEFYAQVQRKNYATPSGTTTVEHTAVEFFEAGLGDSYEEGQTATVDGISFTVDGYVFQSSKLSLSDSKTSAQGKVVNTTPYSTGITNVTVSGASPDIQLSVDGKNWVNLASAQTNETDYYYFKLYYENTTQTTYVNINSITITLKAGETAENVANYIMFEDTNNQCVSKLPTALNYYKNLDATGKDNFQQSDNYVISNARARLEAWATSLGKTIDYETGELNASANVTSLDSAQENSTLILLILTTTSVMSLSVLIIIKKKRMQHK